MNWQEQLRSQLKLHEALALKPYRDTKGKLTIGYGRNLDDVGIFADEAAALLDNDIERVFRDLDRGVPWWRTLDTVRRRVLIDMCFNMGLPTLMEFRWFLAALRMGDHKAAAAEMIDSAWHQQVGTRSKRLEKMMRDGVTDRGEGLADA